MEPMRSAMPQILAASRTTEYSGPVVHDHYAPSWDRISSEGMPDTTKRGQSLRVPPSNEPTRTPKLDPSALKRLLDEWMHEDETEQRETFEILRRSLDEDRPAGYKLLSWAWLFCWH